MTIWTQPGLLALPERDGHGDTCGPIVILDYRHLAHHIPLDITTLDAERAELITWGLLTAGEGMTSSSIYVALKDHYQVNPVKIYPWNTSLTETQFYNDVKAALEAHQLVIVESQEAYNWPGNQAGVKNHFILLGGYDDSTGENFSVYYCNGDDAAALAGMTPITPQWMTFDQLWSALPAAYIILPALEGVPMPIPTGWKDDGTTLTAPNGGTLQHAFRQHVMAASSWDANLMPVGNDYGVNGGDRHDFTYCLEWDAATGTTKEVEGKDYSKPTPPPPPAPLDPSIKNALAAALNVAQPYASLAAELNTAISKLPQ